MRRRSVWERWTKEAKRRDEGKSRGEGMGDGRRKDRKRGKKIEGKQQREDIKGYKTKSVWGGGLGEVVKEMWGPYFLDIKQQKERSGLKRSSRGEEEDIARHVLKGLNVNVTLLPGLKSIFTKKALCKPKSSNLTHRTWTILVVLHNSHYFKPLFFQCIILHSVYASGVFRTSVHYKNQLAET